MGRRKNARKQVFGQTKKKRGATSRKRKGEWKKGVKAAPAPINLTKEFERALSEAKKAVERGGLVIYPTDTLYGIGCNALDKKAVGKIYSTKVREKGKPMSIIVADLRMMREYCELDDRQLRVVVQLLPGPYTFLLKAKKKVACAGEKIGVRVPEHFFMRTVSKHLGVPIVTTSANLSNGKAPVSLKDVPLSVKRAALVIIDNGKCRHAMGSTVIDLVENKIVRKGAVSPEHKFVEP